jgi:hypothetical protein
MTADEESERPMFARVLVVAALVLACFFGVGASAHAYTFGEPEVRAAGPEETVFDWSTMACEDADIPDNPARAFRDALGRVQLIASHWTVRRMIGPSLDQLQHDCTPVMYSHGDPDPSNYEDREWLMSTYTFDGQTVWGLVHDEYQGWSHPGMGCSDWVVYTDLLPCWANAVTSTVSTNGGALYQHATPPAHLVATTPDTYEAGKGPYGVFAPSNIIRGPGDYYYALVLQWEPGKLAEAGACVMRTSTLGIPGSWRAWDGDGFNVRFIDPYLEPSEPRAPHLCKTLAGVDHMTQSVTWSTYLNKYVLVGTSIKTNPATREDIPGFYYSLSDDLVHWTERKLLMQGELVQTHECGEPDPVRDPSLLDPASSSRNFETIGRRAYLYFKRFNYEYDTPTNCWQTLDRDLIRIPIEFTDPSPATAPPAPDPPGSTTALPASPSPASSARSSACARARQRHTRLRRLVRTTRRKLARAKSARKKRLYRRQLRSLERRLRRAASC